MPRTARETSNTGIYHIILRGNNKQNVFNDDEDKIKFLYILKDVKELCGFSVYAYCLMSNHIHLLIKTEEKPLEEIFKRIEGKYVYWYNAKYQRTGHLFQDRFKSEPVEDDEYLLTVICYIHYNPLRAGLCEDLNYRFSSYPEYLRGEASFSPSFITDIIYPLQHFGNQPFFDFHKSPTNKACMDVEASTSYRLTEDAAREIIRQTCGAASVADFQRFSDEEKRSAIIRCHENSVSIRQLTRLTGVSKAIVEKWLREA